MTVGISQKYSPKLAQRDPKIHVPVNVFSRKQQLPLYKVASGSVGLLEAPPTHTHTEVM